MQWFLQGSNHQIYKPLNPQHALEVLLKKYQKENNYPKVLFTLLKTPEPAPELAHSETDSPGLSESSHTEHISTLTLKNKTNKNIQHLRKCYPITVIYKTLQIKTI